MSGAALAVTTNINNGAGVKVQTLGAGESVIVTITIASANAACMQVRPFVFDNSYRGSFTVSEIYNGERT